MRAGRQEPAPSPARRGLSRDFALTRAGVAQLGEHYVRNVEVLPRNLVRMTWIALKTREETTNRCSKRNARCCVLAIGLGKTKTKSWQRVTG